MLKSKFNHSTYWMCFNLMMSIGIINGWGLLDRHHNNRSIRICSEKRDIKWLKGITLAPIYMHTYIRMMYGMKRVYEVVCQCYKYQASTPKMLLSFLYGKCVHIFEGLILIFWLKFISHNNRQINLFVISIKQFSFCELHIVYKSVGASEYWTWFHRINLSENVYTWGPYSFTYMNQLKRGSLSMYLRIAQMQNGVKYRNRTCLKPLNATYYQNRFECVE